MNELNPILRYETNLEDFTALAVHLQKKSPEVRAMRRWTVLWVLPIMLLPMLFIGDWKFLLHFIPILIPALLFGWLVGTMIGRFGNKPLLRRMYAGRNNREIFGPEELELTGNGVITRREYIETRYAWGAIEGIETTKEHTFLRTGVGKAIIIPHKNITDGNYRAFMAELGRRFQPDAPLSAKNVPTDYLSE